MTPTSSIEKGNRHKCHRTHSKALASHFNPPPGSFGWRFVYGWKSSVFLAVALVAGRGGFSRRWGGTP